MKDERAEICIVDEAAAYLKVGTRTVYRLAGRKKISAFEVGNAWRVRRRGIDRWIERQAAATGAAAGARKTEQVDAMAEAGACIEFVGPVHV